MTTSATFRDLEKWVGKTETQIDHIAPAQVMALRATLDLPAPTVEDTELPLPWHWMFFASPAQASNVDRDGHPKRGGFLPPVPLPRRMWAGGRLSVNHALHGGDQVARTSTVKAVTVKEGRTGSLVFVTVLHEFSDKRGIAMSEEQDLVYRSASTPRATLERPPAYMERSTHSREVVPDTVLLFRYSALTFNSHRIHYDRDYATSVEGYPGLVVHGPLIATLLLNLVHEKLPGARICSFNFKAVSPLFDIHPFSLHMQTHEDDLIRLWAVNHEGVLAMSARAQLAPSLAP